jgi:hypothetical protein
MEKFSNTLLFSLLTFWYLKCYSTLNTLLWLVWFGFWCLTLLSTIFQLYCDGQFYWWRKREYTEKTTDTLYAASHWQTWSHNVVSSIPRHERGSNSQLSGDSYWLHTCISSNKSSYHTITTTTTPCCLKTIHCSYDKKIKK